MSSMTSGPLPLSWDYWDARRHLVVERSKLHNRGPTGSFASRPSVRFQSEAVIVERLYGRLCQELLETRPLSRVHRIHQPITGKLSATDAALSLLDPPIPRARERTSRSDHHNRSTNVAQ
jgi:hypothetical protein